MDLRMSLMLGCDWAAGGDSAVGFGPAYTSRRPASRRCWQALVARSAIDGKARTCSPRPQFPRHPCQRPECACGECSAPAPAAAGGSAERDEVVADVDVDVVHVGIGHDAACAVV